jgi:hypothetical protein
VTSSGYADLLGRGATLREQYQGVPPPPAVGPSAASAEPGVSDRSRHTGSVEDPAIDPGQSPTPWRQLAAPLGVCGAVGFVGVLLKGAGNISIVGSILTFVGYIAFIAILGLIAYAITGHS